MRFRALLASWFALTVCLSGVTAPRAEPAPPVIRIDACLLFTDLNAQLGVLYANQSRETLKSITFRARYGDGWLDFVDIGTFAPGAPIEHVLRIQNKDDALKLQPSMNLGQPQDCSVVRTESLNGVIWTIPSLGAAYNIPTPRPDDDPPATNDPVAVIGCIVSVFGRYARVKVRYQTKAQPIVDVLFRARFGTGSFDIADGGNGGANAFVRRSLALYDFPESAIYGTVDEPDNCVPLHVTFVGGATWTNPRLADTAPAPLPTPVPATLELLAHIPIKRHERPDFLSTPPPAASSPRPGSQSDARS